MSYAQITTLVGAALSIVLGGVIMYITKDPSNGYADGLVGVGIGALLGVNPVTQPKA